MSYKYFVLSTDEGHYFGKAAVCLQLSKCLVPLEHDCMFFGLVTLNKKSSQFITISKFPEYCLFLELNDFYIYQVSYFLRMSYLIFDSFYLYFLHICLSKIFPRIKLLS